MPGVQLRSAAVRRVLVLVLLAAIAAGCSGGGGDAGDGRDNDDAATTTTASATNPTAGTLEDEHDDEGLADLTEVASQLLIGAEELGIPGLADQGFTPGPCDDDLDADHPPDVRVGMVASDALTSIALVEEIRVYPDIEASAAAYDAGMFGLCEDRLADRGLEPGEPVDVTAEVGADAAKRLEISDGTATVVVVTAVVGDAVVSFLFNIPTGSTGPDPDEVAAFGVGKVLAALEAG